MALGTRIVAPVASPRASRTHVAVAAWLAGIDDGTVVPLVVVPRTASPEEAADARSLLHAAEEQARAAGAGAEGLVVADDSVAAGVLDGLASVGATLVVMGWQGRRAPGDVFGSLIDRVVRKSAAPLLVVRPGPDPVRRVLLAVAPQDFTPEGEGGLGLACDIADRVRRSRGVPLVLLAAGGEEPVPQPLLDLSDRLHRDPRDVAAAVSDAALRGDLVIVPAVPTAERLREATTRVASATANATLVVAVDAAAPASGDLVDAVREAGLPVAENGAEPGHQPPVEPHEIAVTVQPQRRSAFEIDPVVTVLSRVGTVSDLTQWMEEDGRIGLRAVVSVYAPVGQAALAELMAALHESPALADAEIVYDLLRLHPRPEDAG